MSAHEFRTIATLHYWILRRWIRRALRSPFFWIVAVALGFVFASVVASALGGGPGDDFSGLDDTDYFGAGVALLFTGAVLIGLWRGSGSPPRASLGDVVVLMGTPLSSRAHYAYLMIRDCAENALIIAIWVTAGFGALLVQTGDSWMPMRAALVVLVAVLLSELLRHALWVSSEQLVVKSPQSGRAIRMMTRMAVLAVAVAIATYLLLPVLDGSAGGWRDGAETLSERGADVGLIPPAAWAVRVLIGDGSILPSAIGLISLPVAAAAIALFNAREFVEPISINAERATDAVGRMTEPGADIQWATVSQLGVSPRARVTLRPFGSGPWAILWSSLVRWVRYEITAAWIGLLVLGSLGLVMAAVVRVGVLPAYAGWALAIAMPLMSSVNSFMDELRKQFLFLIPGASWKRLLAGAVTSVLDGFLASLIVIVALAAARAISMAEAVGLLVLCASLALVGQGAVALVQVILPHWTPQRMRMTITFGASAAGGMPALLVVLLVYLASSALPAMLIGAAFAAISGAIMLVLGALLFDRIEFSG